MDYGYSDKITLLKYYQTDNPFEIEFLSFIDYYKFFINESQQYGQTNSELFELGSWSPKDIKVPMNENDIIGLF